MRQPAGASKCIGYDELRLNIKTNPDSAEGTPEAKEGGKAQERGKRLAVRTQKSFTRLIVSLFVSRSTEPTPDSIPPFPTTLHHP